MSSLRSYINSEQEKDREYAQRQCKRLGLDYATERARILAEMIAESRALGKAWEPAAGSRPLSAAPPRAGGHATEGER